MIHLHIKRFLPKLGLLTAFCAAVCLMCLTLGSCSEKRQEIHSYQDVSRSDLMINEVLASNSQSAKAYDGRYYDWIELYNSTSSSVKLDDYYLSDDLDDVRKCSLKGLTVGPRSYLIVYCSGLNIIDEKGFLHTNFKLSSSNGETLCLSDSKSIVTLTVPKGKPDVSYGLDPETHNYVWFDDPTPGEPNGSGGKLIRNSVVINEYMISNTFTLYDCDSNYPDWIELYNPSDEPADMSGYSVTDDPGDPGRYVFREGTVIPPDSYLLLFCDNRNFIDKTGMIHTNFALSAEDRSISLYTPGKLLSDSMDIVDMPDNISCGRAEGEEQPKLFARPTPGRKNAGAWTELSARPAPDINDGVLISEILSSTSRRFDKIPTDFIEIYNSTSSTVNLKGYTLAQRPGEPFFIFPGYKLGAGKCVVVYCDGTDLSSDGKFHAPIKINTGGEDFYLADADGRVCDYLNSGKGRQQTSCGRLGKDTSKRVFFSTPTPGAPNSGKHYESFAPAPVFSVDGGVIAKGTKVSISVPKGYTVAYTVNGSPPDRNSKVYKAPFTIKKNTVIRAIAFSDDSFDSDCVTQTYMTENPHTIPIVCLTGEKKRLIDTYGILIALGEWQEYPVHVEYFDEKGVKAVEFDCGARHFGAYSLSYKQKGLCLKLREIYGQNQVSYNFFDESETAPTTFSSLLLRPSGQDSTRTKLRDEFIPAVIRGQIDIDYQEFKACALYVNCTYWGMYYIREREDADYLYYHHGLEKGTYDLIKSQMFVQQGSLDEYQKLTKFCNEQDLTIEKNYQYICSVVDIDSLINFWIIQTYFGNFDTGNIRCYKEKGGKWKWMVYDFDWAMTSRKAMQETNYIDAHLLDEAGHGSAHFDNSLIRKLLQNDAFRDKFITMYCYHIRHTFNPDRILPILDAMADNIDGEIKLNEARWKFPVYKVWKETDVPFLREFVMEKPAIAYRQLKKSFHLTDEQLEAYKNK